MTTSLLERPTEAIDVPEPDDITRILQDWNRGDPDALDKLVSQVFDDLRRIAGNLMKSERDDHTLQPTALVHELYVRLTGQRKTEWENRAQFFAFAGQVMRRILVDQARRRQTEKRGQGAQKVDLEEILDLPADLDVDIERLDEALLDLERIDPRQSRIVELRFFVGLSVEEAAEVLECSRATVIRDWQTAKLWLLDYLETDP